MDEILAIVLKDLAGIERSPTLIVRRIGNRS
jgi:hypothetical protein